MLNYKNAQFLDYISALGFTSAAGYQNIKSKVPFNDNKRIIVELARYFDSLSYNDWLELTTNVYGVFLTRNRDQNDNSTKAATESYVSSPSQDF